MVSPDLRPESSKLRPPIPFKFGLKSATINLTLGQYSERAFPVVYGYDLLPMAFLAVIEAASSSRFSSHVLCYISGTRIDPATNYCKPLSNFSPCYLGGSAPDPETAQRKSVA
jgi:hypothetical protein